MTGDLNTAFGHRQIYTPRRFYVFMRRTTIPNSSFKQSFHSGSKGSTPKGLTQFAATENRCPSDRTIENSVPCHHPQQKGALHH